MYGAFVEDRLAGFAGSHPEGRPGFLYVEEPYRRQGLGSALASFCINRHLRQGQTPYWQIPADNEPALELQERLGLYLSRESIWCFEKKCLHL
ncbi:MAG: GNAT family N-acetyltransferase [Clostridium sp.]|nr:GNAT family N-acetyltransferase [Acetatifactor muris]MCM1564225.1 GNAT family N-acetyltransferase [Clostridium sp.]